MGVRAHGRPNTCDNTTNNKTAPPPAAPQGPPAPGVVIVAMFSHRFGRCARHPIACHCALPSKIH
eukprot:11536144-Heterocapsa_arctica.AAC.1